MEEKNSKKTVVVPLVVVLLLAVAFVTLYYKNGKFENKTHEEVKPTLKASEYRMSGNSLENFDLYFLKLENEKENKVYSPLSIKYALEMLAEGASGTSKEQLTNIIGDYEARKYTNSENMSFANAFFVRESFKESVKQEYINIISSKFYGEVVFDAFENANIINNWVKEKTLNLLDNLVDDNTVRNLDFALVNALAIDMEWEHKFLEPITSGVMYTHEKTKESDNGVSINWLFDSKLKRMSFQDMSEEVSGMEIEASFNRYDIVGELGEENIKKTVFEEFKKYVEEYPDYSCNESELCLGKTLGELTENEINEVFEDYFGRYIESLKGNYNKSGYNTDFELYADENVKVFAKDLKEYNGTTLQYVGIMPKTEDLKSYISNLNAEKINGLLSNLKTLSLENFKEGVITRIFGTIPKFKFEYSLDLTSDLKNLGVTDIFEPAKANLTSLTSSPNEYIGYMSHKANIEFTQDGIKAAAATMVGGLGAAGAFDYFFEVPVEKIDLTFDKPYAFIIRDKNTGEVWFMGTVYEPSLWSSEQFGN